MRGADIQQEMLFSAVNPEQRVPKVHPLRPIRSMVNEAQAAVWATDGTRKALWDALKRNEMYATTGTRMTVRVFPDVEGPRRDDLSCTRESTVQESVPATTL